MKTLLYNYISHTTDLIMKKETSCMLSDQAVLKHKVIFSRMNKNNLYCSLGCHTNDDQSQLQELTIFVKLF